MRNLIIAAIASLFIVNFAFAEDSGCEAKAIGKNGKALAGAAKSAFMKKCEKDSAGATAPVVAAAAPSCEDKAVSKNGKPLAGAAKAASIKKCEADAKK
ncbi:MAG: hypothetical protein WCI39_11245 [Gallionellaceae bacterium]